MPRFAQLVIGPAGSGKSTYCDTILKHCETIRRVVHVVNLDPAAEDFKYPVFADIRELIHLDDAMDDEDLHFGPNGGLVFCMEYFSQNMQWLREQIDEFDDDYYIFDCPGQIELYTHVPVMRKLVDQLQEWDFRVCAVYLLDSQFLMESTKMLSGMLTALSSMVTLEVSHINVMSKCDLLDKDTKRDIERFMELDIRSEISDEVQPKAFSEKYKRLNEALAAVEDYSLVRFHALDITNEDSIGDILTIVDHSMHYGEDMDVRENKTLDTVDENGEVRSDDYAGAISIGGGG